MKVFAEKKIYSAKGLLLPYSDFRLFSDIEKPEIPKEKAEKMLKYAEGLLDKDIPMLLASVYREYVTNGNRSHYQDPYFLRRDMAVAFAVAEAYENKGRFTEKLMDVVWAIMEESSWIIPAHRYCAPYVPSESLGGVFAVPVHKVWLLTYAMPHHDSQIDCVAFGMRQQSPLVYA